MGKISYLLFVILVLLNSGCIDDDNNEPIKDRELIIRAADLSFLPEIEDEGTIFYDQNGIAKDVLNIFKDNGCNTVRIRVWHTPETERSSLEEVEIFAQRAKQLGFKVWLNIHYSDTWADPGQQAKPSAWQSLGLSDLVDSVHNYTQKVVSRINPDYVQIGNEINSGFLWEDGRITNESNFISLLNSGIEAARLSAPGSKIIVHIAGFETAEWFFNRLKVNNVDYDIAGLSYYPAWHGKNLYDVSASLYTLSRDIGKQIVIAETAYPFTLDWNDWTNNPIGLESHLISGYPATEEGQKAFLLKLKSIIANSPNGVGFCYWAPEWVAFRGNEATNGSAWENMTLFDFDNKVLDGIEVFKP